MVELTIQPTDLITTLEAQRNEAWNAAARAGAATQAASRQIDERDKKIAELEKELADLKAGASSEAA